jgi:hypothetical protein
MRTPHARLVKLALIGAIAGLLLALAGAGSAGAVTAVLQPASPRPYIVPTDASGQPKPFTIVVKGFKPGTDVYVEQCDGKAVTAPHWNVTVDCDNGSSPASAVADAQGVARFDASDPNRDFVYVLGQSPSRLFNCLGPHTPKPNDDLPTYTTCQVRVSTNNSQVTDDQLFFPIAMAGTAATSGGSKHSSHTWLVLALVIAAIAAATAGIVVFVRTRRPTPAS